MRAVAEDVTSEVFLSVAARIRDFPGTCAEDFRRWVFRIATNEINAHLRQSIRRRELLEEAAQMGRISPAFTTPLLDQETPVDWELVYEALGDLSEREQSIVSLRFFAGFQHDQIAAVLQVSAGSVRGCVKPCAQQAPRPPPPPREFPAFDAGDGTWRNDMTEQPFDDWEDLFEQLPIDVSAHEKHRDRLKAEAMEAFADRPMPEARRHRIQDLGRTLMKYKAPHWTAAAILLAGMIWLIQSATTPAFALEDVVNNLVKARTARYDMTIKVIGQPTQKMKALYMAPSHFRQEMENGYVNIADWKVGKIVGLDAGTKRATVLKMVNLPGDAAGNTQMNQFEMVRKSLREALMDPNVNVESLGEKQFGDRRLVGFRFKSGTATDDGVG